MPRTDNVYELPDNIPVPLDDGACAHLPGMRLPVVALMSTSGRLVDLSALAGTHVVYCYPRTGKPDVQPPAGWNEIPGARGCTPQSCAFRDRYQDLRALGAGVVGISTQTTEDQREAAQRLRLPFELLSDAELEFARALRLPTFRVESIVCIKRLTLIIRDGRIETVLYPVFPPDKNAGDVVEWLSRRGERPA
ncbi:MAG: peroxiredoxin [Candidatus Methylomirabilaceae bacterium]